MCTVNKIDVHIYDFVQKSIFIIYDFKILYYNKCFADVVGLKNIGEDDVFFFDFISEKDMLQIKKYIYNINNSNNISCISNKIQIQIQNNVGYEYVTELSIKKILYDNKESYLCTLNDITEFYKSSRRLKRILDATPDIILEFDAEHQNIISANNAIEGIYGVPADQFKSNIFHPIDLVYENDRVLVKNFYHNLLNEEYGKIEYRIVSAGGQIKWVRDEGEVIYKDYGYGDVLKVYHFIRDITERKKNIEQLKSSEKKYRKIFEHSTDPIFVFSMDGKITDINGAALRIFGFETKSEAIEHNVQNFYTDIKLQNIIMNILQEKGSLTDYPIKIKTLSGRIIDVLITLGCRKDILTGNIKSIQAILHDASAIIEKTELESYRKTLGGGCR